MSKRDKQPKAKIEPDTSKRPKATEAIKSDEMRPVWRMGRMEMVDPFGWHKIDMKTALKIQQALRHYEGTTWADLLVTQKKHNHAIQVDDLCAEAKKRLKELGLDPVQELVSLGTGLGNKPRIFGIREQQVLDLLWWDPEHQICPSKKK